MSVLTFYSKKPNSPKVFIKGIYDFFVTHGTREELLEITGLSEKSIIKYIMHNIPYYEKEKSYS